MDPLAPETPQPTQAVTSEKKGGLSFPNPFKLIGNLLHPKPRAEVTATPVGANGEVPVPTGLQPNGTNAEAAVKSAGVVTGAESAPLAQTSPETPVAAPEAPAAPAPAGTTAQ